MKHLLSIIFFFSFVQSDFAQSSENASQKAFENKPAANSESGAVSQNAPQRLQTSGKFYEYILANYRTPEVAGLQGTVIVDFIVNEDGSLSDFEIVQDLRYGTGKELIRVLKSTEGKWKAATQNGQPVKCKYRCPITIQVPE